MTYATIKTGECMALRCLEPGEAQTAESVRKASKAAYGRDDPRMPFHLAHLAVIGLAEPRPLPGERIGYVLTKLGVSESNNIAVIGKRSGNR